MKAIPIIAPAPWQLSGNGFVLLYHFPHAFNARYGFIEEYQHRTYRGWMGAVMLVEYESSDVGPYLELLYIPGLFNMGNNYSFSISKIYVSTAESQWNGYTNWGIPKEVANFTFKVTGRENHFQVAKAGADTPFFSASLKPWGFTFPVTSRLLPVSQIIQQKENVLLKTNIFVEGTAKAASLQHIHADPQYFPPIHQLKPVVCLSIEEFKMKFPVAEVVKESRD